MRTAAILRDAPSFLNYLLSTQRQSWLTALDNEPGLRDGVLDDQTFNQLLSRLKRHKDLPNNDWLELLLPCLNPEQIKRLYKDTGYLRRLAQAANLASTGATA